MVLAVARATARKTANAIAHRGGHTNGPGQKAVHKLHGVRHASTTAAPHGLGSHPPKPTRSPPHKLFTQSKNILSRLFTHLTAPGFRVPTYLTNGGQGAVRSLQTGATPTISSRLSLHARTTLSSGPRNIFLPHPPAPGYRVVTNLGLGTARKFSTARPIFQNIVDNVPVIGRAIYEADLDLRNGAIVAPVRIRRRKRTVVKDQSRELLRPINTVLTVASQEEPSREDELDQYFHNNVAPVSTYLFVPLPPTPSSRVPLPTNPVIHNNSPSLLPPLSLIEPLHDSYDIHGARVSSLFLRLEQADVWSKGVKCSTYGHGVGTAAPSVIVLEFIGWTEAEVRSVIGEAGTGWCGLEEVRFDDADDMSDLSSAIDPIDLELPSTKNPGFVQSSSSFIMPTLDFSSSAIDYTSTSTSLASSSRPVSSASTNVLAVAMEAEYDNPWSDGGFSDETSSVVSDSSLPSSEEWNDLASERSWQGLGALQFSALDVRRF